MNELITTANEIREELTAASLHLKVAISAESRARLERDAAKDALADGEAMELAGADMTGFHDANGKALAVSSKAYQTARDAYMAQARANGLHSLVQAAERASEAHSEAVVDVGTAKVSFDAVRAAAALQGEMLRFTGSAEQAGLVAQVEAIAQTVGGLQAAQSEIAVAVQANGQRIDGAMERGKRATAALETAGRALASFSNPGV